MDEFIYYKVGGKTVKIPSYNQQKFEDDFPSAQVLYTYNGQNVSIPLENRDRFISDIGADNLTYSAYDDDNKYSSELSTRKVISFESPEMTETADKSVEPEEDDSFSNWVISANDALMRAQHGLALPAAKHSMDKATAAPEEVDKEKADLAVESHKRTKAKIDEFIAEQEKQYNEAVQAKGPSSFWERVGGTVTQTGYGTSYETQRKVGQDYVDARIAKNITDKTADKVEQYLDPANTFIGGAVQGVGDTVFDLDTWISTIGLEQATRVLSISKKLDEGGSLTDGEQLIIDALVDDLASDIYMSAGFGRGYKAGKVTGESLPFMIETMLNPASGLGKSISKKLGGSVLKRVTTRLATDVAGAMIMSATTSQPRVVADAFDRLSGEVDFTIDDNGQFHFNGFVGGEDSMFKAYAKAYGANTIEHFSEMVGEYFSPIGKKVGKWLGLKKILGIAEDATPNGFGALMNDFIEKTQWNGILGEFSEEIIGGALNALVIGDQTLKKYDENGNLNANYLFDKDNLIDTFLGVSLLGGFMSTAKTIGYATPGNRYDREVNRKKKNLEKFVSKEEMGILEAFANNPMGVDYANLEPFFGEDASKEYKTAVAEYLRAVMEKQGHDMSVNADLSGTRQGMEEMKNAFKLGQSMTEADLYDVSEAEAQAIKALEDAGLADSSFSSYDLFNLSQDTDFTEQQQIALRNLALVRNAREGLVHSLYSVANATIKSGVDIANASANNGMLTYGEYKGRKVFVKGDVSVSDGKIVAPSETGGHPVEIVDSMTGEVSVVESKDISKVNTSEVEMYNSMMSDIIRTYYQQRWEGFRNTKSVKSKLAEISQFVGQKVFINTGNGMAEVDVKQILPNGEVLIKGKKGDLGGQSTMKVDVDSFYDSMSRDANGNPIFDQSGFRSQSGSIPNAQQTSAQTESQPATSGEAVDYRDTEQTILINGQPVAVTVDSQDDTSDRITYSYTENNKTKVGSSTIAEFEESMSRAAEFQQALEEAAVEDAPVVEETEETVVEENPTTEEVQEEVDWDNLLETDPETYFAEMQKMFGDKTAKRLEAVAKVLQNEIDALNKAKPTTQAEIFANEEKKEALQARIDSILAMIEKLNQPVQIVDEPVEEVEQTEGQAEETQEETQEDVVEEPVEEVTEEEDFDVFDANAEETVLDNGYIIKDGYVINPTPIEIPGSPKDASRIFIAEKDGKWGWDTYVKFDNLTAYGNIKGRINTKDSYVWRDSKEDAIKAALKYFDYIRNNHGSYKGTPHGNTGIDAFVQYVKDTYLNGTEEQTASVAPNPVENPIEEARKKEKQLDANLKKTGLSHEQKQDLAYNAGKAVADMFATREEYDAYAENATDFGAYNSEFERGVEESFAARTAQTISESAETEEVTEEPATVLEDKYPARTGDVSASDLISTFGFREVSIPTQSTLNAVYDVFMNMSKLLGISPKSIGHGGTLAFDRVGERVKQSTDAQYGSGIDYRNNRLKGTVYLRDRSLSGMLHEWWHSLDHALQSWEDLRRGWATSAGKDKFGGREEVRQAVLDVIRSIKKSGHMDRLKSYNWWNFSYFNEKKEQTARAFEQYIMLKFAENGIVIDNVNIDNADFQPTVEEMKVIEPAFDNLFKVLQEKEGKEPGTSVLFQIGNIMQKGSEAWKLATETAIRLLEKAGLAPVRVTNEQAKEMLRIVDEVSQTPVEKMTAYHGSSYLFDEFDHSNMGRGEGAQAHGWGTYVTLSRETGVGYAEAMRASNRILRNGVDVTSEARIAPNFAKTPTELAVTMVELYGLNEARARLAEDLKDIENKYNSSSVATYESLKAKLEMYKNASVILNSGAWSSRQSPTRLYTVEVPNNDGKNYLSEDKVSRKQMKMIAEQCEKDGIDFNKVQEVASESSDTREGARLYEALSTVLGSPKAASELLSRAGFTGISYVGREDGSCMVIFNETDAKITGRTEMYQEPDGTIYGWTDGKTIYLTDAGMNPNTPIHEYTHIWARAMMKQNPKGWNSIKDLLRNTDVWEEVLNDKNYESIKNDEDAVASEVLSRFSGANNAAKLEQMAQQMIDEAKGTMQKSKVRGLIQNIKDALNQFWSWVGKELFGIEKFNSIEEITDRVLYDLVNQTELRELSEGNAEKQALRKYTDRSKNNIAKEPNQEFRDEVAYEIMRQNFQHSGQDLVFANKKAYLVSHPESAELGISAGYSIEKVLDLSYLSDEQRKEAEKLLADYNGDWGATVVSVESMWPRSGRIDSNLRILNDRRSEGNDGLLADRQRTEGNISERGDRGSHGDSGYSGIGSWTKTVYDGSRERRIVYRDELDLEDESWNDSDNPDIRSRKSDVQNAAVDYLVGDARLDVIERAVNEEATKLGVEVTYKTRSEMPDGHQYDKGYYNPETGEVVICTENASSIADAIQTILHEAVAHKGLRALMGDKFNEFINRVYDSLDAETKAKVDRLAAEQYDGNTAVAMEEYMASLAESENFAKNSVWDKIKSAFESIINAILGRNDIKIGDNELRYILRASYNNMVNPRGMETIKGWAQDQMMREDLGIGKHVTPEMDAEYLAAVEAGDMETAQRMVNEAAKIAMPNTKIVGVVYHGVSSEDGNAPFKTIDRGHFTDDKGFAEFYSQAGGTNGYVYNVYLNLENPLVYDFKGQNSDYAVDESGERVSTFTILERAKAAGHDGVILENVDEYGDGVEQENGYYPGTVTDYLPVSSSQIKSADPVTYDDNGNIIPLSKRFNLKNDGILYRTGIDPAKMSSETAAQVYDRVVEENFQEVQRQFQDAYQPVRIAIDAIQQETGNIPIEDYENYLLMQNHASSRSRVEVDNFKRRFYDPLVDKVNNIVESIIKSRGLKNNDSTRAEIYKEVRQYLIAKHGLERNRYYQNETEDIRDYSGLTSLFGLKSDEIEEAEALAENLVEKFENEVGTENINALWSKINSATNYTLRHGYESGIISRAQYEKIKGMFKFYIPLRGFDETTAEDVYEYSRIGETFNPLLNKTQGRTSLADDPIATIMNMAESEISHGNNNKAKQALYNFLLNRTITDSEGNQQQNTLMQIESVWYVKSQDANGNEVWQIAAPDRQAGETYEQFEERMQKLAEQDKAMMSAKGSVDVGKRFQNNRNKDDHYVYVRVGGVEKAIYINGNPKAANAINHNYPNRHPGDYATMRKVNRFLSSMFTNYSLEFTVRNIVRDALYSRVAVLVKENAAYRRKFRKNWWKNFFTVLGMLKKYRSGKYDNTELKGRVKDFVEFMDNGGQTGYTLINSVERNKEELEKMLKNIRSGLRKGIKNTTKFMALMKGIEVLNEASELVTRFSAYQTSRQMGRSIEQSIHDGKEITVNFNTKGAQDGTGVLGWLAKFLGASKYFFNASVQGVQNLFGMAKKNKIKFGSVVCGMMASGALMPIINGALASLLGYDDDDDYWNIPEYERQNNLCIILPGGDWFSIPLPVGFREMFAIGDMVMACAMDKKFDRDPMHVGMDMANKVAQIVLPVNPLEGSANGLTFMEAGLTLAAPDMADFLVQWVLNKDFKGAPLQKETDFNKYDPEWTKAFASNPAWMKGMAKWLNDLHPAIDASPEKIDNTLSNLFGGMYSLVKKTGKVIEKSMNDDRLDALEIPVVDVFFGEGENAGDRFITNSYYEMKEYYDERISKIKKKAESFGYTLDEVFKRVPDGEARAGEHQPEMSQIYNLGWFDFDFMQEWYLAHKGEKEVVFGEEVKTDGLDNLWGKIDRLKTKINKNPDGQPTDEQLAELTELQKKYDEMYEDFVFDMLELD